MIWRGVVRGGGLEAASEERTGACREAGNLWRHLTKLVMAQGLSVRDKLTLSRDNVRC